jgi:hypothetical protein
VTRPSRLAVTLLLPLAAFSSGCGWLGTARPVSGSSDAPRLSRATLVARVEAACALRTRALAALPRPRTKKQRREFFARVAAIERTEFATLAALRPPRDDEREFHRLVDASGELAEISHRFHGAVVENKPHERRRAVAQAERASEAYDRAARRLGLACSQSA